MFTEKCFIRTNYAGLRDKLYRLGNRNGTWLNDASDILVSNQKIFRCCDSDLGDDSQLEDMGYIDCGTNEELFLAIAALRDDTDNMQWFTDGEKWYKDILSDRDVEKYGASKPISFHKATVEELIEHFKP